LTILEPVLAGGLLALLGGNPAFRRLFAARAMSLVGDWFAFVALSGLLYDLTDRRARRR
jgi:hypothetical protein